MQQTQLKFAGRTLQLETPQVMGVLNVTPDSFSDGGRHFDFEKAVQHAQAMAADGAAIIDIGGESTRPGAQDVSVQQELDRVIPVIEAVRRRTDVVVSIDTSKAAVMRESLAAGATIVNDVYALQREGTMQVASENDCAVCLMHMLGEPGSMQQAPQYDDVVAEIHAFLQRRVEACVEAGIEAERIVVDPGFGFGKSDAHNIELLSKLDLLQTLGRPMLVGLSRKRTLGNLTGRSVDDRLAAGLAAAVIAVERGASIVRTHDVAATADALRIVAATVRCRGTDE